MKLNELNIGDQQISFVDEYNYLGFKIDNKLSFTAHLKALIRNVVIRKYLNEFMAVQVYKTMISPIFNYANIFLYSGAKKLLKKLLIQQNQSIRIIIEVTKEQMLTLKGLI